MLVFKAQLVVSVKHWYVILWMIWLDLHTYQSLSDMNCLILQNVLSLPGATIAKVC